MNRHIDKAICIVAIVAAAALVGCGSDGGGTDTAGNTSDSSAESDTFGAGSSSGGGGSDAGSSDLGSTPDAGPECTTATQDKDCKKDEWCKDSECVKTPPCWDKKAGKPACKKDENCSKDNKCVKQTCKMPTTWSKVVNKVSKIEIPTGTDGACDLTPGEDGKPDNALGAALSAFSSQIKGALEENMASGDLVIALEANKWDTSGKEFAINALLGKIDPSQAGTGGKPICDPTKASCKYVVNKSSYDVLYDGEGTCPALVTFNNAKIDSKGTLTAGGPKQKFVLSIPILSISLDFILSSVTLEGMTTDKKEWKSTTGGKLCGLLKKKDIEKAIDSIPDEELASLGGKDVVKQIVEGVLKADIDADGDGEKESVSTFIKLDTIPGEITGLAKD